MIVKSMFGAVAALIDGSAPTRPKRSPIGASWLEWVGYCMWRKAATFNGEPGVVTLVIGGTPEERLPPVASFWLAARFDVASARSLRDRLDAAIEAAEAMSEVVESVPDEPAGAGKDEIG